uniref:Uncharacterized protein n=1 Tax=Kwoniella dejecticola CBS 10117 TaxID=1296121 RepID=A0A1A5ZW31_9TREE|nr:uncharacterized protein I303_07929 [Kwoniella dejecticola CBS 10117]OBR82015.1 hypothetical protein I303_07929 [Kwoniella dejecticola CBS 10117]
MTFRDSFISTTSSDTYPSTMSSLSSSMLGLTDSPLRPRLRSTLASTPASSAPGSPVQQVRPRPSQQQLRQAPSRNSLVQEATTNAARRVIQQGSSEGLRTIPTRSSQGDLSSSGSSTGSRPASRASTASTGSTAVRQAAIPAQPVQTSSARNASSTSAAAQRESIRPAQTQRDQSPQSQPSVQSRPASSTQRVPVPRQNLNVIPPSPAKTEITLAEEWESELIADTRKLNIRPTQPASTRQGPTAKEREEQRLKDIEWERSGLWETERDPAREAEDRVRRDLGRDVAYPPATPRVPIRAAPTASDSMIRNQPDPSVPLPLFSPASASADLPTAHSTPTVKYDHKLAEKARKEYEDWKARKAEREGGIGDDGENHGTRDWVPKTREVARPGNAQPQAQAQAQTQQTVQHSPQARKQVEKVEAQPPAAESQQPQTQMLIQDGQDQSQHPQAQYWGYPYPYSMGYDMSQMQGLEGYYPDQAYWDPSYWWVQSADPNANVAAAQEGSSEEGASAPVTPEDQYAEMANSMMYNNPYQWGQGGGNGSMMQHGQNPYAMMGYGAQQSASMGMSAPSGTGSLVEQGMKPFDSSQMKQGRLGHYGYLEGRELAGPPVGFLPAGVDANQYNSPGAGQASQISPSHRAATGSGSGSVNGSMAWGDSGNGPRARYDGSSSAAGYVQADLDTPYPRTAGGGASSAFTRYGPDGSIANGIDGRMGIGHRRLREGRV